MGASKDCAEQKIGLIATLSVVVGSIIGAGIFMLPVSLAPLGWNAALGWLLSGSGAVCLAFALSRLTCRGEGIQAHLEEAFGATPAFVAAWSFWCGVWTTNAALAIAAASALSRVDDRLADTDAATPLAISFMIALTAVNALGVRSAGRVQLLTTLIKIVPLIAVVLLLFLRTVRGDPMQPVSPTPIALDNIATATTLTLFALLGFENATTPVNKVENARRVLPIAIVGGTAFVAFLYLLSSTAVPLLLSSSATSASPAPFADALASEWGETTVVVVAACIAVSAFGCLNSGILAAGELGYAMAARGDLPRLLARTREDRTPVWSQCLAGGFGVGLILLNSNRETGSLFTSIILIATVGMLVMYLLGALGALRTASSTMTRGLIIGGILFAIFAFYGSGLEASAWGVLLIGIGLVTRLVARLIQARVYSRRASITR